MEKTSFENLQIYLLAEELSDLVWDAVAAWRPLAQDTVGKQFVRAADSIGANIAEGDGKGTFLDNRRFLRTARGSLYECKHWLRRAIRRNLISPEKSRLLQGEIEALLPKLNAYLRWVSTKIAEETRSKTLKSQSAKTLNS